jgi:AcrR family transcriptional regulator
MTEPTARAYHHGDLRRTVIDTAFEMMGETGDWQFTLREIARRSGVSHAAPYKHFPDKASLLAELAMIGFDRLGQALTEAASAPAVPRDKLLPMSRAYVDFGTRNPALYRLMFGAETSGAPDVHLGERALATFAIVLDLLTLGQEVGDFRSRAVRDQAAACWALFHGMTLLAIDGLLIPEKVGANPLEGALQVLLEGLSRADTAGSD